MSQAPTAEPVEPQDETPGERTPAGPPAPPLLKRLQQFFAALDKQVRGFRMYQGEGAVIDQLARELEELTTRLLAEGSVTVRVTPFGLSREGKAVTPPDVRIPYLFRMYLDGIRELTLLPGLSGAELERLVKLLAADAKDDEDMVTVLWSARLEHVRAYAVDRFGSGVSQNSSEDADGLAASRHGLGLHGGGTGAEVALSADDVRVMRTDAVAGWIRDASTQEAAEDSGLEAQAAALRQAMSLQRDPARFVAVAAQAQATLGGRASKEASPLVLGVLDGLVEAQDGPAVAAMLERLGQPDVDEQPGLVALREAIFEPDRAVRLAPLVHADPDRFLPVLTAFTRNAQEGLVALLTAMPGSTSGEPTADSPSARLQRALDDGGVDMTAYWAQRLDRGDEDETLRAIAALGQLGGSRAAAALEGALGSTLGTIRRAALTAMMGSYDESVRETLGRLLRDPDRDNRLMAAEILAASGDPLAARRLLTVMSEPAWRGRDLDERIATTRALARFRDPRAVDFLSDLLAQHTAVSAKDEVPLQIVAVEALAIIPGAAAQHAISRAAGRWLLARPVKQQAAEILRKASTRTPR